MKVIVTGRQTGKTEHIVKLLAEDPEAVCLVPNEERRWLMIERLDDVVGDVRSVENIERQVLNVNTFHDGGLRLRQSRKVYIDELDAVLFELLLAEVDEATLTGEIGSL